MLGYSGSSISLVFHPEHFDDKGLCVNEAYEGQNVTYSPKNGTMAVGRPLRRPHAVVPAPP